MADKQKNVTIKTEVDLGDSEKKIETAVEKAKKQAKKAASEVSDEIEKQVDERTNLEIQAEEKINKERQSIVKEICSYAKKEFTDSVSSNLSKVKDGASELGKAFKEAFTSIPDNIKKIKESFGEFKETARGQVVDLGKKMVDALAHPIDSFKKTAKEAFSKTASDALSPFVNAAQTAKKVINAEQVQKLGSAYLEVGKMAISSAASVESAMDSYILSTGKSADETEAYQGVLENIYSHNYGESFDEIASAMAQVTNTMGDMGTEDLESLTESAFALKDAFGVDIVDSTAAAKTIMDEFKVSGEEAMNLIAAGAMDSKGNTDQLMEGIAQYSEQFSQLGVGAEEMFALFASGAETGSYSFEELGGAVSEMASRIAEGSEETREGLESMGLNADEIIAKFQEGGESAGEAFEQTMEALESMEDPLEQSSASAALFGEQWGELGPQIAEQFGSIEEGAYGAGDAMQTIKDMQGDDLGSMFDGMKRSLELLLVPLGEALIPLLTSLLAEDGPLAGIGELLTPALGLMEEIGVILIEVINQILPPLIELVGALLPIFEVLFELLTPIIDAFMQLLAPITQLISEAIVPLITIITQLMQGVLVPLQVVIDAVSSIFSERLQGMFTSAKTIIEDITGVFQGIIDFLDGVFKGDWDQVWEAVSEIFGSVFEGLKTLFTMPINFIIDGINGFIKAINKIKVPDWVPGLGGLGFNISLIPRLKKGLSFVPSDYFPAYLDYGERVLTRQENQLYSAMGGIGGMIGMGNFSAGDVTVRFPEELVDYRRLGEATVEAFDRAGIRVYVNSRELGRLIKEGSRI